MRPKRLALTSAAILFLLSGIAVAEEEGSASSAPSKWQYTLLSPTPDDQMRGMDTDRPNKTNTPHTIDAGHVQLESGFFDWVHYRNRYQGSDATTDTLALGHFNVRLGLFNNLEANIAFDSRDFLWNKDHSANQSLRAQGFGDTVVGGKLNLWGNDGSDAVGATAFALQPQLKIPSAGTNLGNNHPEFFFGAPFLINLPADFHLALQTTLSWERNRGNTGDVTGWQNSASLDRVIFGALDLYVEYWSHVSSERHIEAQQTFDFGLVYALSDNVTLDAGAVLGLNRASNTAEFLSGMSIRF